MSDATELFLSCARLRADAPAVRSRGQVVSYATLEATARRFASVVARFDGPRVLIALPQGADAYAAMFGVALGGGYYAPVNVSAPPEKLARITQLFEPEIIIAPAGAAADALVSASGALHLRPEDLLDVAPLAGGGRRHDIAYVIFTSGTTGLPKGVVISRAGLDHYVGWLTRELRIAPDDIVSQHPNIAFDLSVMDIYGALASGASLSPIVERGDRLMPALAIARERITVWISVPSVVSLMMRARQAAAANLGSVRLFAFCGEPLLPEQVDALFAACPSATVLNTYGPTEATVSMTELRLTAETYRGACASSVAIGEAIDGMALHLIGGADDSQGEIAISGPQLASGYWRSPEETERAFRTVPLNDRPTRLYFTGDWAERRDGMMFFRERRDFQVKLNGFRLELDEVAAAIRSLGWSQAVVVKWRDQIVSIVETSQPLDERALQLALRGKLEAHAIPARILTTPRLPRSDNDKIDRGALLRWLETI